MDYIYNSKNQKLDFQKWSLFGKTKYVLLKICPKKLVHLHKHKTFVFWPLCASFDQF